MKRVTKLLSIAAVTYLAFASFAANAEEKRHYELHITKMMFPTFGTSKHYSHRLNTFH